MYIHYHPMFLRFKEGYKKVDKNMANLNQNNVSEKITVYFVIIEAKIIIIAIIIALLYENS